MELSEVSPEEREALYRELQIQKLLKHNHIVKLFTHFEEDNRLYIVLEYVENGNLFQFAKKNKLTQNHVIHIFKQMLETVAYLHSIKLLHRDIKPENVLMVDDFTIKLCDFGFCAPYGNDLIRFVKKKIHVWNN